MGRSRPSAPEAAPLPRRALELAPLGGQVGGKMQPAASCSRVLPARRPSRRPRRARGRLPRAPRRACGAGGSGAGPVGSHARHRTRGEGARTGPAAVRSRAASRSHAPASWASTLRRRPPWTRLLSQPPHSCAAHARRFELPGRRALTRLQKRRDSCRCRFEWGRRSAARSARCGSCEGGSAVAPSAR